ncbi:MAG: cell division protein FtsZ [Rhizobacter sp.]|nr:cell division protein FtsZ [Ferruginibacter sp.]
MIHFDLPKDQSSIIKVIGVGGGGSNAVNHMFSQNIEGVNFIICNTDAQAIATSKVPNKIQLGPHLTQGLGAGANPAIGRQATEESLEEIKRILEVNTKMAFITAGMGGGTGTGGAPILAKICKDLGILTVGIVTTPFAYEGKKRIAQAEEGIMHLKNHVDTLLVISNDKLRHQFGNLKMKEAFAKADNVLATAAKCITDVINSTGQINVDFADVCTVMSNGGVAILGSAIAEGENRAQMAIENALNSPLLNDNDIRGAKWILININSAEGEHEFTMDEVEVIQNHLLSQAGEDTDVILGLGYDNTLGSEISITLIATGFEHKDPFPKAKPATEKEVRNDKIVMELEMPKANHLISQQPTLQFDLIEDKQPPAVVVVEDEKAMAEIQEEPMAELKAVLPEADAFMPILNEHPEPQNPVELLSKTTVEKKEDAPEYFEISSAPEQTLVIEFDLTQQTHNTVPPKSTSNLPISNTEQQQISTSDNDASNKGRTLSSGSFLAKPAQIYATEKPTIPESNSNEEPLPMQKPVQEDEPVIEMQLVVKDSQKAAEDEPLVQQTQPIMMSTVEDTAMQDETEELRRRATERIAKLRNLSFNINAADPNNEFETVPAYLRRNMEMHNQIADVESFYSNYTVKTDDNNQAEISTINTFLDGKKPD